jgi:hypothetical protein
MSDHVEELGARIRALSAEDRLELIRELLAELDGPGEVGVEQAWLEEVEERHKQLLDGQVQGIEGSKVFQNLQSRLKG